MALVGNVAFHPKWKRAVFIKILALRSRRRKLWRPVGRASSRAEEVAA
ncbi:hypothetical protein C8C94_2025 [Acidovorax sp. 94]|nr:hypothetical protein C8C94_2025 [Acidovorax sp. 94]